jgi:hypothetical protein
MLSRIRQGQKVSVLPHRKTAAMPKSANLDEECQQIVVALFGEIWPSSAFRSFLMTIRLNGSLNFMPGARRSRFPRPSQYVP